eukprot:4549130-Pleurochrysis_carterae.AAC.2
MSDCSELKLSYTLWRAVLKAFERQKAVTGLRMTELNAENYPSMARLCLNRRRLFKSESSRTLQQPVWELLGISRNKGFILRFS